MVEHPLARERLQEGSLCGSQAHTLLEGSNHEGEDGSLLSPSAVVVGEGDISNVRGGPYNQTGDNHVAPRAIVTVEGSLSH